MRRLAIALLVLLFIPGGCFVAGGALLVWLALGQAHKIDPSWSPDWRVLLWGRVWGLLYGVPSRFLMAVLSNEAASNARPPKAAELALWSDTTPPAKIYPVGDDGQSWGSGQVLDRNLPGLWRSAPWWASWLVVKTEPRELALVGNEAAAMYAAVRMMAQVLHDAGGDEHEAAAQYNGGPAHQSQAAEKYAELVDEKEAAEA